MALPKVGERVYIAKQESDSYDSGNAKVLDIARGLIYLDRPLRDDGGGELEVAVKEQVRITYYAVDRSLLYFDTAVAGMDVLDRIPSLQVHKPNDAEIVRIQRRNFARVELELPLSVSGSRIGDDGRRRTFSSKGLTLDLSAGGMAFSLRDDWILEADDLIDVSLEIDKKRDGSADIVKCRSFVVRRAHDDEKNVNHYSARFVDLEQHDQQKLVQKVFQRQIELRRKK